MTLVYRSTIGRRLTVSEGDGNISELSGSAGITFLPSGTGTVARSVSAVLGERVSILGYTGGVPDGSTNQDAAVLNAVTDVAGTGKTLWFPRQASQYVISAWPQVNLGGYTVAGDGWIRKEASVAASPGGAVRTSNVVTITTSAAHGFTTGQTVVIANVVPVGATSFNGTFVIASAPLTTTFTYAQTAANDTGGKGACSVVTDGSRIKVTGGGVALPYGYGTGKVASFGVRDIAFIGVSVTDGSYGLATNGSQSSSGFEFRNVAFTNFQYGVNPKSLSHTDFYHLDVSFCANPVLIGNGAFDINFYGAKGNWASNIGVADQVGGGYAVNFWGGEFDDAFVSDVVIAYSTGVYFYGTDLENASIIPTVASVQLTGGSYNWMINCTTAENFGINPALIISGGTYNGALGGAATGAGGITIGVGATNPIFDKVYHNGTLTNNSTSARITDPIGIGESIPGTLSVGGTVQPKQVPSTAWGVDFAAPAATPIAASGTYDVASGSGLIIIHDDTTGDAAAFLTYGGNVTKLGGAAAIVSGAPGASETGLFYNAGTVKYRIQNGYAVSHNYFISTLRTRNSS